MRKILIAALFTMATCSIAQADPTLSFNPASNPQQFDASGNLAFALVPDGVTTTETSCKLKLILATNAAPLNKGKIKNAGNTPDGALLLFTVNTPENAPNTALNVSTTGLSSKPNKGNLFGRAAMMCGTKKKTYVFSPIVKFDFALITAAKGKAAPQVSKGWKQKTATSF